MGAARAPTLAARRRAPARHAAALALVLGWLLPALPSAGGAPAAGGVLPVADTRSSAETKAADERAARDLEDLRRRIREAQRDVTATEESRTEAADALRKSEQAISESTRTLRELGQQEATIQSVLANLGGAQQSSRQAIAQGQARLASLLRHQYEAGGNDSLALLLSGQDASRVARDAEYLRQLAQARSRTVDGLRRDLVRLADLRQEVQQKAEELARTRAARAHERARLQSESATRAEMVAELSSRLIAQKRNLQTLERDEKRLTQLVERIARAIEERRLQREKAQRERAEREKQQRERAARGGGKERAPAAAEHRNGGADATLGESAGDDGHGGGLGRHPDVTARIEENSDEDGYALESFAKLKGRLRLPVAGELANHFGSPREDSGLNWRGLFIRAPEGREVHAVAAGRVVFSDWLRGFGNLLIIDHGSGYMSLYGNNESLFVRLGDFVKGGAPVASVGNSGGNPEPGLYFEIRYQSKPFDPLAWVGRP